MSVTESNTQLNTSQQTRDTTMDFAKGLAILLMVLDHIVAKGAFITSFHMPLFFFVSGYFLKEEPIGTTFQKKVRGLLLPYLEFGLLLCIARSLYIVPFMGYTWKESGYVFLISLRDMLLARNVFLLWFLPALFLAIMIYVVIVKLAQDHLWIKWMMVLGFLALGGYLAYFTDQNLWYFDVACVSVSFVAAGAAYRKYRHHLSPLIRGGILAISAILWGIGIANGGLVLALRKYPLFPLCVLAAIGGTIVVLRVSTYLRKIPYIGPAVTWCGRHTLEFLAIANLIRALLDWDKICYGLPIVIQFAIQLGDIVAIILVWDFVKKKFIKN